VSDLGDMVRLYDRLGIEHEIIGVWSTRDGIPTYIKTLNIEDPESEAYPGGNKHYGFEFRFSPFGEYIGMTMWYQMRNHDDSS